MPSVAEKRLGEILVKDKIITSDQLTEALKVQDDTQESLGKILVKMSWANEWEIAAALGKQLNVPFIRLEHYEIDPDVINSIPEEVVRRYKICPIDRTGDTLTIAVSDPANIYILDELRLLTKAQIIPVVSYETDILDAINRYYGGESKYREMIKDLKEADDGVEVVTDEELDEAEADDLEATDAPVIKLVNLVITEAIKGGASDIHVEPQEKSLRLRYRLDGVLHEQTPPPKKFQNAIISRIKIMSGLDIAEKRLPQDGRFKINYEGRMIDFRVSTCANPFGEKVVIRILDRSSLLLMLTDLGFEPEVLEEYNAQIRKPWGMLMVTGPTGSGKSTTLYATLHTINDPRKNIITIEDPIEYQLKGITQVHARPEIGLSFAAGLRSFLRQDPDIILVGEVRDFETADMAVKAALTGHLVLSTLHTNDAASTPNRMINMGVEPYLVAATLNLVVAQRLVRRICTHCKEDYEPSAAVLRELELAYGADLKQVKLFRGKGCSSCHHSGYRGRIALYEVMPIDEELRDFIVKNVPANILKREAIRKGMVTLRKAGMKKVMEGMTTLEEVLSITIGDER